MVPPDPPPNPALKVGNLHMENKPCETRTPQTYPLGPQYHNPEPRFALESCSLTHLAKVSWPIGWVLLLALL